MVTFQSRGNDWMHLQHDLSEALGLGLVDGRFGHGGYQIFRFEFISNCFVFRQIITDLFAHKRGGEVRRASCIVGNLLRINDTKN